LRAIEDAATYRDRIEAAVVEARAGRSQLRGTGEEPPRVDSNFIPLSNSADEAEDITYGFRAYMIQTDECESGSPCAGVVTADLEYPKIIRALACPPSDFRSQGKAALITEINTLVDLAVFEWVNVPRERRTIPASGWRRGSSKATVHSAR
jgi:hypothetical protein